MAKQPARKRQKTSRGKKVESVPLGTVKVSTKKNFHDDDQKDEDELRLESLLFGKKYVAKRKGKKEEGGAIAGEMDSEDDDDEEEDRAGKEMQHLQDSDVSLSLGFVFAGFLLISSTFFSRIALCS